MNFNNITKTAKSAFYKASGKAKRYSPEIFIIGGIAGVVTSGVMACFATLKVNDVLVETQNIVEKIHECENNEQLVESGQYTHEDAKRDLMILYVQTGVKFVKLYAPAVLLGTISIACIVRSHHIMKERNVALAAAYATIDKSYKEYRSRVVERFGEAVDRELKYNIKAKKIEETEIDPETGKEKKVKKTVDVTDGNGNSEYARFFDDGCLGWEKDAEMNLSFLRSQQKYANDLLQAKGHLFLNEVYDMLGIKRSRAGQVVGWVYDPKGAGEGDNYVDFGIYDMYREYGKCRDFVNGHERVILLDFNVDGPILDKI